MRVSELQTKDVVSILDGRRLGRIIDIEMTESGQISFFLVEPKRFLRFFSKGEESKVSISDIKKIGEDVILVEIK